ncbi:hypothetical protein LguiB_025073 [Lonicera macranthoides]
MVLTTSLLALSAILLFTTITLDEPAHELKTILSFKVPDQRVLRTIQLQFNQARSLHNTTHKHHKSNSTRENMREQTERGTNKEIKSPKITGLNPTHEHVLFSLLTSASANPSRHIQSFEDSPSMMLSCATVSNPPIDDDRRSHLYVHHRSLVKDLPRYSFGYDQCERTFILSRTHWKLFNGRFSKQQFVNWLLEIEKYLYYFKVSKEQGAKYIYGAFTRKVQLWWDDFQRDRHSFGFPPINTCGLMVYLLIEEYYSNDIDEILSWVNQLFLWVYNDYEEVQNQQQNSLIEDMPKKKVETPATENMKLLVSPVIKVHVPCVNIDDIPKFIKGLKSLSKFDVDEENLSLIDFRYCEESSCTNPTWQSRNYRESDVSVQDFLGIENYFHGINTPLKLFFNNLRESFLENFKRDVIQFVLIMKLSKYLVGWYGRHQFSSLNSRTSFFEERVNDEARVKTILIYYLCNFNFIILGQYFLILVIRVLEV